MRIKPLVSVITPCYNGERFMSQWANNLFIQDYPNVEIIFVNDGSKDDSAGAFKKESERLQGRGYIVHYVEKPNGGAADALNHALPLVNGSYIMLLDMDDFLFPDNISAKADYLTEHEDTNLVRSNGYLVRDHDINDKSTLFGEAADDFNPNQFEEFINMRIKGPYPGSYMIRSDNFFSRLSDNKIYVSKYGQNFQMVIPAAYENKSGYISKPLMKYVYHTNSHSHSPTFERRLDLFNGYENNMIACINFLDIPECEKQDYIKTIKKANLKGRFMIGVEFGRHKFIREQYKIIKNQGHLTKLVKHIYFVSYLPLGCFIIKNFPRLRRVIKRLVYRMKKKLPETVY